MKEQSNVVVKGLSLLLVFTMILITTPIFAQEQDMPSAETTVAAPESVVPDVAGGGTATTTDKPGNVTLDFKDADILLVLRLLSLKSGVNIVAGPEVSGTVTIRLHDVPWEKALDVVLRTYGYVYERDNKIIRVTTRDNLAAEELTTETFVLNYSTAQEISSAIEEIISERGRLKAVERTNMVIVTDVATNIYKIGEIIKRLDKRTPQVYIDSTIVRTGSYEASQLGIKWFQGEDTSGEIGSFSGTSRDFSFPWKTNTNEGEITDKPDAYYPNDVTDYGTMDFSSFTAALNLLKSYSSTKILSNPRIVTLSNKEAVVKVAQEYPVPIYERNDETGGMEISGYESRDVGVILHVTPHVNDASEILVELEPEVSTYDGQEPYGELTFPVFGSTTAITQVLIKNRETIAIGGLAREQSGTSISKVPVLGDIPGLKRFFRYEEKNQTNPEEHETLFFITCTIVDTQGQAEETEDEEEIL